MVNSQETQMMSSTSTCHCSIVASVPACQAGDLGLISGSNVIFSSNLLYKVKASIIDKIREYLEIATNYEAVKSGYT
jgi:hypothetical protein